MRLTLVHNPTAGESRFSRRELTGLFRAAGYDVRYVASDAGDLSRALAEPGAVVAVAGGDGTVASVATELLGHDVPLAVLPTGGSNNIARSFGLRAAVPELVAALRADELARVPRVPWNVGLARAPWGEARFVEAAGLGPIARMLQDVTDNGRGKIGRGRRRLRELVAHEPLHCLQLLADDEDLSGDVLLLEVLNVRSIGPRVELACTGDLGADDLALVVAHEQDRASLGKYLEALLAGRRPPPPLTARRVRHVRVSWEPRVGHLDDEPWPSPTVAGDAAAGDAAAGDAAPLVDITIAAGRLELLVPGRPTATAADSARVASPPGAASRAGRHH